MQNKNMQTYKMFAMFCVALDNFPLHMQFKCFFCARSAKHKFRFNSPEDGEHCFISIIFVTVPMQMDTQK